ncbi:MAG: AAA family ATPase [Prevotellaceae bacterium]|jgi:AAA15 family ATPase/GTPase|nr:AAA family ATPase [Prevotellaceae bacterium]
MFDSLNIKNYRNLEYITIDSLRRVNLITGKNNTGKSTILEALAIYATKGDLSMIYQLLEERGEGYKQKNTNNSSLEINIQVFASLFTNRKAGFDMADAISIGNLENTLFGKNPSSENHLSLRFVKYMDEVQKDEQGNTIRRRRLIQNNTKKHLDEYKIGLEIKTGDISQMLPLDEDKRPYRLGIKGFGNSDNVQFIRTKNIDRGINGNLFDNITLTEKEQYVVEALKIIEPQTERIAFIEETQGERSAVIKLSDSQRILPLQSMGDGINRILTIILALVNADNGFLLIDEFENGLHHTVQEQLWNIIFRLSQKLNIQVFATTHSEDCIRGFEHILNSSDDVLSGKLIRLDNKNGKIKQVEFDANELRIANEQDIDVR